MAAAAQTLLSTLRHKLGFAGKKGGVWKWKLLAFIFAILNLKSLPLAWHIRLLKGLITHIRTSLLRLATTPGPSTLFQPLITSSRSGFLECDYNLHKSNATYFSDFDVGRLELLVALCGEGMRETWKELAVEEKAGRGVVGVKKGRFEIRLGGVSCLFRKEIRPYEKFEVWTRVLAWDQKWLYVICHFVKPGVVKPKRYTLQPWRKGKQQQQQREEKDHETEGSSSRNESGGNGNPTTTPSSSSSSAPHPAIFAAGIAKYVCKKGRLTIPPERVLSASKLLPPKPPADDPDPDPNPVTTPPPLTTTSTTPTPPESSSSSSNTAAAAVSLVDQHITPSHNEDDDVVVQSLKAATVKDGDGEWTWERVEAERKRGLGIAEMWASLEGLSGEFGGDGCAVLGRY